MKIRTQNCEIKIEKIFSESMKNGVYTYPALRIVLPDGIPSEDVAEILSGSFDILTDNGDLAMTYEGYTTLKEISVTIGKITTADQRVEELEAELATVKAEKEEIQNALDVIVGGNA